MTVKNGLSRVILPFLIMLGEVGAFNSTFLPTFLLTSFGVSFFYALILGAVRMKNTA